MDFLKEKEEKISLLKDKNKVLQGEKEFLQESLEQYKQSYEAAQNLIRELKRTCFGSRSERFIDPDNPQIDYLLSELNAANQNEQSDDEKETTVPEHKRRKQNKKDFSKYPCEIRIIPVADEDRECPCGCQKKVIRYESKTMFHHRPAEYSIIEERREVVACEKGCSNSIQTAPSPKHILPKARTTEALLSHIVVSKVHHRQPHYHLEKYLEDIDVSRETLSRWFIQLVAPLQPIFNLMKDEIINYDISSLDATTLQVLKEPGRRAKTKSYVYCMLGGPPDKRVILYSYNNKEHKAFVDQWFEGFTGYAHMDADIFFKTFIADEGVHPAFCHAHARRKYEKITKAVKKQGLAHEAMRYYKKLYKIEREAKEENCTPEARYALRQEKSKPILKEFKQWLEDNIMTTPPKSPIRGAMEYQLKRWPGFETFLTDGRLFIDNNHNEQEIKPFVIGRKNFLFSDSVSGAHALCMHFSLVRTALANKLNPYRYYVEILKKIPHCESVDDYEALLPWNIKLESQLS